jgi:hypothetical protein
LNATQTHFALRANFAAGTNVARNALRTNLPDRANRANLSALALRPALALNARQSIAPVATYRAFRASIATRAGFASRAGFAGLPRFTGNSLRPYMPDFTSGAGHAAWTLRPHRANGADIALRTDLAAQPSFAGIALWPLWAMEKDRGGLIFKRAYAAHKIFQRTHNPL